MNTKEDFTATQSNSLIHPQTLVGELTTFEILKDTEKDTANCHH